MLYAGGVYAFLLACLPAQTLVTTNGTATTRSVPAIVTPSSGITIDTDPSPANPLLPTETDVSQAAADKRAPLTAVLTPPRTRSTTLKRPSPSPDENAPPGRPWYRSSLIGLAVVLGLILLVSRVLRRYVPAVRALGGEGLRVVQRTPLSSKQSVALVQVGQRMVLIGITPDHVSSLAVIDDPEECARLRARTTAAGKAGSNFEAVLSQEADKFDRAPVEAAIDNADGSRQLRDTRGHLEGILKKLKEMQVK